MEVCVATRRNVNYLCEDVLRQRRGTNTGNRSWIVVEVPCARGLSDCTSVHHQVSRVVGGKMHGEVLGYSGTRAVIAAG